MRRRLTVLGVLIFASVRAGFSQMPATASAESATLERARATGAAVANGAVEYFNALTQGKIFTGQEGIVVAEGDSWFNYPGQDVLSVLQWRHGYRVDSTAHRGDTLESMAYDAKQFSRVVAALKRIKDEGKVPRAVLLSAGGNDIAGPELAVLLNHSQSGLAPVDVDIAGAVIARRQRLANVSLASAVTRVCQGYYGREIPIFIHGYDYPTPDGRGFGGAIPFLPGPWLKPAFDQKGYPDRVANTAVMRDLIDRFNAMLKTLPSVPGLAHVRYVGIVGTLSHDPVTYLNDWSNELHPSDAGFLKVAARFHAAIQKCQSRSGAAMELTSRRWVAKSVSASLPIV